ncbi:MAG: DnrO protein [Rhodanobacteraceae bacterium]|jgi:hypothetical protein|nr:DnrO protein [Rhodanobacteraceae bacterium]MBL0041254.1 DnrO protein [Xanthomonadales bacterium]MBP6079269.1 DnrO protein [Xanthomonadales bacterium]MBP7624660.1 DnrO protein [Xanthomonadales bacterium]
MKSLQVLWAVVLFIAAPYASAQDQHAAHAQAHHHPAAADAPSVPAKRWAVDAPLRAGMGKIRAAVESLGHHEMGHLDKKQVVTLAAEIDAQVQYLIANCKLDPKADAALHGIIGALLAGSASLKDKPDDAAPVATLRAALADYPKFFDDPTWQPLAE